MRDLLRSGGPPEIVKNKDSVFHFTILPVLGVKGGRERPRMAMVADTEAPATTLGRWGELVSVV